MMNNSRNALISMHYGSSVILKCQTQDYIFTFEDCEVKLY